MSGGEWGRRRLAASGGKGLRILRRVGQAPGFYGLEQGGVARSTRHKSGVAMRFPRINRIRTDKPAAEADSVGNLLQLIGVEKTDR